MTTTLCPVADCGRPADGMCSSCWAGLSGKLDSVTWLDAELKVSLTKQARFGAGQLGVVARATVVPLPYNTHASDAAHHLHNTLVTWVRALHAEHAVRWKECTGCGEQWISGPITHAQPDCPGAWVEVVDPLTVTNKMPALAAWLLRHTSWVTGHLAAAEVHHTLTTAIAGALRAIDRPLGRLDLGVCATPIYDDNTEQPCGRPIHARDGADTTRCLNCGTVYLVDQRRRDMLARVDNELASAADLVGVVNRVGIPITSDVIRGLVRRGRLHPKVRGRDGYLRLRESTDFGVQTFRVGDVLDILPTLRGRRAKEAS